MNQDMIDRILDSSSSLGGHIFRRDRYFNAAVLILLMEKEGDWYVLLQKRAKHIRQGGEISFPGGGHEKEDMSYEETAIRETIEEMGVEKDKIRVYGKLPTYIGRNGLIIEPYIGEIDISNLEELSPDRTEVEAVLSIPLSYFVETEPMVYHTEVFQSAYSRDGETLLPVKELGLPERYDGIWGTTRHDIYVYTYEGETIWGITADILYDIAKRLVLPE